MPNLKPLADAVYQYITTSGAVGPNMIQEKFGLTPTQTQEILAYLDGAGRINWAAGPHNRGITPRSEGVDPYCGGGEAPAATNAKTGK